MFRRHDETGLDATITVDGTPVACRSGESLAAALLAAGFLTFRSAPRSGAARGPFCGMGVCFECLVEVDGAPARQACLTPVQAGMRVVTHPAAKATP
jgi:NADH dehydrogenase/NADH:ubiquinone oxidoreductase subunit G